ncbi:hypothetical protein CDL12_02192 [Handroanthus impetiginosus]|uniref:Uncharacterized protein n=1 Tax=Handroanthus impetiginosus TaxID=429701 RepID=A0A2G9I5P1_9LAMI|nr:hypothetical protein CDL12_02192 [Handroanthus impetiginosus]
MVNDNGHRHVASNRWQVSKLQSRSSRYASSNLQISKHEPIHKPGPSRDRTLLNGSKVWTKKLKNDSVADCLRPFSSQRETSNQTEENKCEVIIGSIPLTLRSCVAQQRDSPPDEAREICSTEPPPLKDKYVSEKVSNANTVDSGTTQVTSKLWRPVSNGEARSIPAVGRSDADSEGGATLNKVHDQNLPIERSGESQSTDGDDFDNRKSQQGWLPFNSSFAREFLAQRWKGAISGEHVTLVLSASPESPDVQPDSSKVYDPSDPNEGVLPPNAENQLHRSGPTKFIKKGDKSLKVKYIPKQKPIA